jgi:hypothetical protein
MDRLHGSVRDGGRCTACCEAHANFAAAAVKRRAVYPVQTLKVLPV